MFDEDTPYGLTRIIHTIRAGRTVAGVYLPGDYVRAEFDLREARRVRTFLNDIRKWSRDRAPELLYPYGGESVVAIDGAEYPFETDEATLDRLQRAVTRRYPDTRIAAMYSLGELVVSEWPIEDVQDIGSYMSAAAWMKRNGDASRLAPFDGWSPMDVHGNLYLSEMDPNTIYEIAHAEGRNWRDWYEDPRTGRA